MNLDDIYTDLTLAPKKEKNTKLVLAVLDGLGDVATAEQGYVTPLEAACTPNLDALVRSGCAQGRMIPVAPGITPGSGPGHVGLFGYDPIEWQVGRGVLEALGIGIDLAPTDVAARANFCTMNDDGTVADRRAGRIDTSVCQAVCKMLAERIKKVDDIDIQIEPVREHRFVVVLRGKGLGGPLTNADPNVEGQPIPTAMPIDKKCAKSRKTAHIVAKLYEQMMPLLAGKKPTNGFLLRGIDTKPKMPSFLDRYKLRAAAIATYPMYKGLASLVGMTRLDGATNIAEQFERYLAAYNDFDFFFIHFKYTDKYGEDGKFDKKREAIEEFDAALPILLSRKPTVLAITADHSTPCVMKGHSWHPQPALLHSPYSGSDKLDRFTETGANLGSLGLFEAKYLTRYMQANARLLDKFGA